MGDPTDYDTGWNVVFKRVKTGPLAFNVEYQLQVLRCKPTALSADERAAADAAKTIDEKYPRPTSDEVKALLDKITASGDEADSTTDNEAINELG